SRARSVTAHGTGEASGSLNRSSSSGVIGSTVPPGCDRSLHRGGGLAVLRDLVELRVLLTGVDPVLELDHTQLGEPLAQPPVARVEETELLAVGHDLREQQALEDRAVGRVLHRLDRLLHVDTEALPRLLLQEPVAHAHRGFERELLALADLRLAEAVVVLLQREHAEGDVTRL